MAFITIEDLRGRIELLVFPKALETTGALWQEEKIVIADGKLSDKDGSFKLIVDDAKIINPQEVEDFKRILATQEKNQKTNEKISSPKLTVTIAPGANNLIIKKLSQIFDLCKLGETKVFLNINNTLMQTSYSLELDSQTLEEIKKLDNQIKAEIQ